MEEISSIHYFYFDETTSEERVVYITRNEIFTTDDNGSDRKSLYTTAKGDIEYTDTRISDDKKMLILEMSNKIFTFDICLEELTCVAQSDTMTYRMPAFSFDRSKIVFAFSVYEDTLNGLMYKEIDNIFSETIILQGDYWERYFRYPIFVNSNMLCYNESNIPETTSNIALVNISTNEVSSIYSQGTSVRIEYSHNHICTNLGRNIMLYNIYSDEMYFFDSSQLYSTPSFSDNGDLLLFENKIVELIDFDTDELDFYVDSGCFMSTNSDNTKIVTSLLKY